MLELPLDLNVASVKAYEAQFVFIVKMLVSYTASVNKREGVAAICLLRVSCHISEYAATCYIALEHHCLSKTCFT